MERGQWKPSDCSWEMRLSRKSPDLVEVSWLWWEVMGVCGCEQEATDEAVVEMGLLYLPPLGLHCSMPTQPSVCGSHGQRGFLVSAVHFTSPGLSLPRSAACTQWQSLSGKLESHMLKIKRIDQDAMQLVYLQCRVFVCLFLLCVCVNLTQTRKKQSLKLDYRVRLSEV